MSLRTRRTLPLLFAAALLLFAAPASAGRWHKHHKHHHHHHHHHGCGHYDYAPAYVERHYYGYPVYHYPSPGVFLCGPCGHHFESYDDLSYHVHHRHHVAVVELPSVIFQASIGGGVGWVFGN